MYLEIPQGRTVDIQGLQCHLPPEGYVYNNLTKQLEYTGIYSRSDIEIEQYWERIKLPGWYKEITKREDDYLKKKKDDDAPFYDEKYEKYKTQEWNRRLNGFWFWNYNPKLGKSEAIYLTGFYYMLLQWFNIDIGFAKFIIPHLHKLYFLQYCIEDPLCMGMIDITKRRFLKTFIGGLFILEYVTRTKMVNGALQSKTGNDAKKVFGKAIVYPFRKFPRFFRPEYDMSLGINPKTELRFQQTNVRGKKAEDGIDKDELGSMIDWGSADPIHFDGSKLHRYFSDEWGKTTEANIFDRHEVIRYCLLDEEGKIIGKCLYSTTVEKLESDKDGVQEAAKDLWAASDQNKREKNGMTQSGMYRFFQTSDEGRNFDIYGYPDVEQTIKDILSDRDAVKHNIRSLSARMHKEPRTIEEAFSEDADGCIFNIININKQKAYLKNHPVTHWRFLHFYRDINTQLVKCRDVDPLVTELYWKMLWLPKSGDENKYNLMGGIRYPDKAEDAVIGVDGYSNTQGGKEYGSKLSGWLFLKFDINNPENTGMFVGHIYGRPNEKDDMYNQILLCAEYCGFPAYFEFVADDYYTYFKNRGRVGYLPKFPKNAIDPVKLKKDIEGKDRHRGFPTTPFALTKQNDAMMTYVEHHCDKIYYEELLEDLPKFRPYKRGPHDRTVSAMITLVSSMEPVIKPPKRKDPIVQVYENENYRQQQYN